MRNKLTNWQKQGMIMTVIWVAGMIVSALLKNIYFEVIFAVFFITTVISSRLNIERQLATADNKG